MADYAVSHLDLLPVDAIGSRPEVFHVVFGEICLVTPPWEDSAIPGESGPTDAQRSDMRVHGPTVVVWFPK